MWTPDEVDRRVWGWRYQEQISTNGSTVIPTERSRVFQVAAQTETGPGKVRFHADCDCETELCQQVAAVHCLCDMCRYYCLLRAGKKSLINKTMVEMTTRKKNREALRTE